MDGTTVSKHPCESLLEAARAFEGESSLCPVYKAPVLVNAARGLPLDTHLPNNEVVKTIKSSMSFLEGKISSDQLDSVWKNATKSGKFGKGVEAIDKVETIRSYTDTFIGHFKIDESQNK